MTNYMSQVSYNAAGVLAHMASDGPEAWTVRQPERLILMRRRRIKDDDDDADDDDDHDADDDVLDDDVQVFRSRPHGPRDQPLGHLLQQEHQLPLLCTDHQVDWAELRKD